MFGFYGDWGRSFVCAIIMLTMLPLTSKIKIHMTWLNISYSFALLIMPLMHMTLVYMNNELYIHDIYECYVILCVATCTVLELFIKLCQLMTTSYELMNDNSYTIDDINKCSF